MTDLSAREIPGKKSNSHPVHIPTPPTTLYELRFDNDEYYVPLGLFDSEAEAEAAWKLLTPKLNDGFMFSYAIEPLTLHHAELDSDQVDGAISLMRDHNEDVLAYESEDEEPDDPPADEEGEQYHPLEPSPGRPIYP